MTWLAGPLFALALLALGAGTAKVARPAAVVDALWRARLPLRRHLARTWAATALGVVEIIVGAWVIAFGSRAGAAVLAALYFGFAGFAARLLAVEGSGAACGCFGSSDSPASRLHVVVTSLAGVLCALATVWPVGSVAGVLRHQPAWGLPFAVLTVLAAWLVEVLLTTLPAARATPPKRVAPGQ